MEFSLKYIDIPVRVNDLKQYIYCPRTIFFQYVMPVDKTDTVKMEMGRKVEVHLERLERRRKLTRYGIDKGTKKFRVWLNSNVLNLSGKLDLLIESDTGVFPVDFKFTDGGIRLGHVIQVIGYCMILEEKHGDRVHHGFVYLIPRNEVIEVEFSDRLKKKALWILNEIRGIIATELMPEPTPFRNRCVNCEYRNYCNDVF